VSQLFKMSSRRQPIVNGCVLDLLTLALNSNGGSHDDVIMRDFVNDVIASQTTALSAALYMTASCVGIGGTSSPTTPARSRVAS
jgi:hypothetical protein